MSRGLYRSLIRFLLLSRCAADKLYERSAQVLPPTSAGAIGTINDESFMTPLLTANQLFPSITGIVDLEYRQQAHVLHRRGGGGGADCATWVCPCISPLPPPSPPPDQAPTKTHPTDSLSPTQEPPGPWDASDCSSKFDANLGIKTYATPNCTGDENKIGHLNYYASTPIQGGFRSFKISRWVGDGETLAFFQYGVATLNGLGGSGGQSLYYNWICGEMTGGILSDDDTKPPLDSCWDVPGDGFAQCLQVQRSGICPAERQPPPADNQTSAPSAVAAAAPQRREFEWRLGQAERRWAEARPVPGEPHVCEVGDWNKDCYKLSRATWGCPTA